MNAYNFYSSSISELKEKLESLKNQNSNLSLAIVFSSVSQDIDQVSKLFAEHQIQLVGCTTAGEFVDSEVGEEGMSVMLMDMPQDYFDVFYEEGGNTLEIAKKAAQFAKDKFKNPALVVFSSGLDTNGDNIIKGVNKLGNLPLFGGLAGDDLKMQNSYVFTQNSKSSKGLLFLIIDQDKIIVSGLATSGWKAVGTPKIATKAEGNILYTIDNEPALDVFLKYFKIPTPEDKKVDIVSEVGMRHPLQLEREGYKTLRAPLMAQEDGALVLAGEVPQGSSMYFSMPPDFDVIDQSVSNLSTLKDSTPEADAMILVSCTARNTALGPMIEGELEGLHELWNAPLIGFFSYGEIGTIDGASVCDLHNETVSLILLKEK